MPQAKKLQGWVTLRGPSTGTLVQDEDEWLDLEDYTDIAIWYQVTDASNVESFVIETSPVRESETFVTMASLSTGPGAGPSLRVVTWASDTTPLARFLRWKCTGRIDGSFSITFRAWVVAVSDRWWPMGAAVALPGVDCACLETGDRTAGDDVREPGEDTGDVEFVELFKRGPFLEPPKIRKVRTLFKDPCLALSAQEKKQIAALEAEKKYLQEELNKAGPGEKSYWAGQVLAIQKEITSLKNKVGNAYKLCCQQKGGNPNGALTTTVPFATFYVSGSAEGKNIGPFQFSLFSFDVVFTGCWNSKFKLANLTAPSAQQIGDVTLAFTSIVGEGVFDPTSGAMMLDVTFGGTVSAYLTSGTDSIEFELSTGNLGGAPLQEDKVFPGQADGILTGKGKPMEGGLLAQHSATFTGEFNLVNLSPLPFITLV